MNLRPFAILVTLAVVTRALPATAQDMDSELSSLADKLATVIKEQGKKKVAVVDFADLQGGSNGELGRYIAEQLTVNLVMRKRDFSVLDRANLRSILAEHKLTSLGLVDPENAKKLGMFAGVDALILGTMVPKGQDISLTAKVITTDTAEIVGAARADFRSDNTVRELVSKPAVASNAGGASGALQDDKAKVVKSFGDLYVQLGPLQVVGGEDYLLTMVLTNHHTSRSLWVAVSFGLGGTYLKGALTDPEGNPFSATWEALSGVEYASNNGGFSRATEIKPGQSLTATIKFRSHGRNKAVAGSCRLQLELLSSQSFRRDSLNPASVHNLVTKIDAL